mgnify:FL=1
MVYLYPTIYRLGAATCGSLTTIPLDIIQTQIISKQRPTINFNELKFPLYNTLIFTIQNTVYSSTNNIDSQSIRGLFSGLSATPLFYVMETKKMVSRLNVYPIIYKLILWLAIREIVAYVLLYNIIVLNIPYSKFIGSLVANSCGFPLKFIAQKKAYPILNIQYKSMKKTATVEILKNSISDAVTLYLIYNFSHSPFKI